MDTLNDCEVRTDYVVKKKAKVYQKERNIEKLLDALGDCFVEKKVKITQKKEEKVKSYWMHSTTVRSGRIMLLILCTTDWTTSRMLK